VDGGFLRSKAFKRLALVVAGLVVTAASLGLVDSSLSCANCTQPRLSVVYIRAFTNDDGVVNESGKDSADNGIDPGNGKAVASCTAWVDNQNRVRVTIANGYPGYRCRLWVKMRNVGCRSVRRGPAVISSPSVLSVVEVRTGSCSLLRPGDCQYGVFDVDVRQSARELATYYFTIETRFTEADW
jgi:hypothetical protein